MCACQKADCTCKACMHDFGWALNCLKSGKVVARKGWNGKGQFLVLTPGKSVSGTNMHDANVRDYYKNNNVRIMGHIDMKAADDSYVVGWLASQTDMLAEDWEVVEV